jgi:hypothetical protein
MVRASPITFLNVIFKLLFKESYSCFLFLASEKSETQDDSISMTI